MMTIEKDDFIRPAKKLLPDWLFQQNLLSNEHWLPNVNVNFLLRHFFQT